MRRSVFKESVGQLFGLLLLPLRAPLLLLLLLLLLLSVVRHAPGCTARQC